MPKHNIYPHARPDQPDGPDTRIEIGWTNSPTGCVQLSTTKLQPGAPRDQDFFGGPQDKEPKYCWDGTFVDMDRGMINHLIQELRDIRDKAFGKDQ